MFNKNKYNGVEYIFKNFEINKSKDLSFMRIE